MSMSTGEAGRKGALARSKNMTKAERSESARIASVARWAKHNEAKKKEVLP